MAPFPKPTGRCFLRGAAPLEGQQRWCRGSGGFSAAAPPQRGRLLRGKGTRPGTWLSTAGAPPAQPPPRGGEGRRGEAAGGQRCASKGAPRPPTPGTSPACKMLSGFLSVKDRDNFKPLKPDGLSSICLPARSTHSPKKDKCRARGPAPAGRGGGGAPAPRASPGSGPGSGPSSRQTLPLGLTEPGACKTAKCFPTRR